MEQGDVTNNGTRKRVLFLITKSVWGGAQRYVYDLATALPKDSYDVAVAFGGTGTPGSGPGMLKEFLEAVGIRTIFIPELVRDIDVKSDRSSYQALRALFKKERPDVLHINSSKAGGLGALAGRREKVPRILYTAHGWAFTEPVPLLFKILRFLLSSITVLLVHRVICVSESDRSLASGMPFVRRKLIVIHNGIRHVPQLTKEEAREALFTKEIRQAHAKDLWLVSVAELTMNKNLFRAIDAVSFVNASSKSHKKQQLFYCIIGDGEQREALEGYCQQRKVRESVLLLGTVPESRRYLHAFDAALLPSLKEGFPYAILEAGAAGIPVAASKTGGIPEIIEHGLNGLLIQDSYSSRAIANALSELLDENTRRAFGEKLKERIDAEFSFEKMRMETFALY